MNPTEPAPSEAEAEEAVMKFGTVAALAWLYFIGCVHRAQGAADEVEAAGFKGVSRLLPSVVAKFDPAEHREQVRELIARGIVSAEEADKVLAGNTRG